LSYSHARPGNAQSLIRTVRRDGEGINKAVSCRERCDLGHKSHHALDGRASNSGSWRYWPQCVAPRRSLSARSALASAAIMRAVNTPHANAPGTANTQNRQLPRPWPNRIEAQPHSTPPNIATMGVISKPRVSNAKTGQDITEVLLA
jgi:hypothetical protein